MGSACSNSHAAIGAPPTVDAEDSVAFVQMLGDELIAAKGKTVKTGDALAGKVVALYFSAHWCPPCRGFTPKLAEYYQNYKAAGKQFEIVFVSSDNDDAAFAEYFGTMPWLALPFADRARKEALSKQFKVRGIPSLVILDTDGTTITTDGRSAVSEDPKGEAFPWRPQPLSQLLGGGLELQAKDGATVKASELASKHLLLYFSAHWCPPCRGFTPQLAKHYEAYKAAGLDLEVIFVSSDRDASAFSEYHGEMPWLALPYADRARKAALSKCFDVSGIPSLVVLGPADPATGERAVINVNARAAVGADGTGAEFPWAPKPLEDLAVTADCNGSDINESPALVLLMEGCDDETQAELKAAMSAIAVDIATAGRAAADGPAAICFYATTTAGVVERVRELCKLPATPSDEPTLLLLDIPDEGGYYVSGTSELSEKSIRDFLASFQAGSLKPERKQLGK